MTQFRDLNIGTDLLEAIEKLGFTEPTQIQADSIPHILNGKDVVGESATGSGKTLAFGCGIIKKAVSGQGVQALVLTPTRELAEQVKDSLVQFKGQKKLKILAIYGGVSINPQIDGLQSADVVVATPGRLLDHMQRGTIDLSTVKLNVLDEADRMFDMGFIEDVEKIIGACPNIEQNLFFSATISDRIMSLSQRFMKDLVKVTATRMVDPTKLTQIYYDVKKNEKLSLLVHLVQDDCTGLVMVFCNTRRTTEFVTKALCANKVDAISIHGGMTQNKRIKSIESFNNGKKGVLICTDVAARGLHIDNVSHVYNYEVPNDPTDYVHRIGRTARAGEDGKVVNLICDMDHGNFGRVMDVHRDYEITRTEKPRVERVIIPQMPRNNNFGGNNRRRSGFGGGHRGRR